jgi:NitT/TauT family transport system substrate-binding protein
MSYQIRQFSSFIIIFIQILLYISCADTQKPLASIQIGVLVSPNSLPMVIAEKEGYFKKKGIEAHITYYQDTKSKNLDFEKGNTNIMITDLSAALKLKSQGSDLSIISLIRGGEAKQGRIAIITGPNGIHSLDDLKGKKLAVIPNSISEFGADQILHFSGIPENSVEKDYLDSYNKILNKVANHNVTAGVLVTPLVTFAEFQGCRVLADDSESSLYFLVLVSHENFLKKNTLLLKNFLEVYYNVVTQINQKPSVYKQYLLDLARVPSPDPESIRSYLLTMTKAPKRIRHSMPIPEYSKYTIPNKEQIDLVSQWLVDKKIIPQPVEFKDLVFSDFANESP